MTKSESAQPGPVDGLDAFCIRCGTHSVVCDHDGLLCTKCGVKLVSEADKLAPRSVACLAWEHMVADGPTNSYLIADALDVTPTEARRALDALKREGIVCLSNDPNAIKNWELASMPCHKLSSVSSVESGDGYAMVCPGCECAIRTDVHPGLRMWCPGCNTAFSHKLGPDHTARVLAAVAASKTCKLTADECAEQLELDLDEVLGAVELLVLDYLLVAEDVSGQCMLQLPTSSPAPRAPAPIHPHKVRAARGSTPSRWQFTCPSCSAKHTENTWLGTKHCDGCGHQLDWSHRHPSKSLITRAVWSPSRTGHVEFYCPSCNALISREASGPTGRQLDEGDTSCDACSARIHWVRSNDRQLVKAAPTTTTTTTGGPLLRAQCPDCQRELRLDGAGSADFECSCGAKLHWHL